MDRWFAVDPVNTSSVKRDTPEEQPAATPPTRISAAPRARIPRLLRKDPYCMTAPAHQLPNWHD
jgi:hypothetical protein